jgi:hypothetical protein
MKEGKRERDKTGIKVKRKDVKWGEGRRWREI